MKIISLIKNNKFYLFVVSAIITSSLTTYASYLIGDMVQFAVDKNFSQFVNFALISILCYFLGNTISYFRAVIRENYLQEIATNLRKYAITSFKTEYINSEHKNNGSKYFNMATSDVQYVEEYYKSVLEMVTLSLKLLIVTIFLININLTIILVVLFLGILMAVIPAFFQKRMISDTGEISTSTEKFNKNLENYLNSASSLKNANSLSLIDKIIKNSSDEIKVGKVKRIKSTTKFNVIIANFGVFNQIFLLSFSSYLAYEDLISFGMIFAISSLSGDFFSSLLQLLNVFPNYAYLKAILKKFDNKNTHTEENIYDKLKINKEISIKNLSYSYENKTLKFPNITFEKNKKYIIVGDSGSGKSTLINIINGNYKNYSGDILLDGKNLKDYSYSQIKNSLSTMEQQIHILNASIKDNIILNKKFDLIKFNDILEKVKLDKIVDNMQEKEETLLDSTNNTLSGGQLQRIALARTLYQDAEIILIDEGTANLDNETAQEIEEILFSDKNLTVIMITHHLTDNIKKLADEIIKI